jgi:hypothetical protein
MNRNNMQRGSCRNSVNQPGLFVATAWEGRQAECQPYIGRNTPVLWEEQPDTGPTVTKLLVIV